MGDQSLRSHLSRKGTSVLKPRESPSDFCVVETKPERRLSNFERLTITGGDELNRALQWMTKQFSSFSGAQKLDELQPQHFHRARAFYSKFDQDPASFFSPPGSAPEVKKTLVHGLPDGEIVDLEFASPYIPQADEMGPIFSVYKEAHRVHARMWRHSGPATSTIIAIHGWAMGDQRINSLAFLPGLFYRAGANIVIVELPYHGRRKPTDFPSSRFVFPGSDIFLTNESMGQIISELRALKLHLEKEGATNIGAIGMSLGAYIAELWAGLDELAFVVPIVPLVSMAEVAWDILTRMPGFNELEKAGITSEGMKEVFRVHSPLTYPRKIDPSRVLIVAGIGDKIVPARQPKLLWDHWKRPKLVWFSGGHSAQVSSSKAFNDIIGFLSGHGFVNRVEV